MVSWRDSSGGEGHAAVRGGVLRVSNGDLVEIATREAVCGDDLKTLETEVVRGFREDAESDKRARSTAAKLELAAIRHIHEFLYPGEGAHRTAPLVAAAGLRDRREADR